MPLEADSHPHPCLPAGIGGEGVTGLLRVHCWFFGFNFSPFLALYFIIYEAE